MTAKSFIPGPSPFSAATHPCSAKGWHCHAGSVAHGPAGPVLPATPYPLSGEDAIERPSGSSPVENDPSSPHPISPTGGLPGHGRLPPPPSTRHPPTPLGKRCAFSTAHRPRRRLRGGGVPSTAGTSPTAPMAVGRAIRQKEADSHRRQHLRQRLLTVVQSLTCCSPD